MKLWKRIISGLTAAIMISGSAGVLPEGGFEVLCVKAGAEICTKTLGDSVYAYWDDNETNYPVLNIVGSGSMWGGVINPQVTSIFNDIFDSVIIEYGITTIKYRLFHNLKNLHSVYIPDSISLINEEVFSGCSNLKDIYYTGSKSQWNSINGIKDAGIPFGCTIHYNSTIDEPVNTLELKINSQTLVDKGEDNKEYTIDFVYSDDIFSGDSRNFNYDLAKLSSLMAQAAYPKKGEMNNFYAEYNLKKLGFESINDMGSYEWIQNHLKGKKDNHFVGYTFANKKLPDGSTLIAIVIKGTSGNEEWLSNFEVGKENDKEDDRHFGFNDACYGLENDLKKYLGDKKNNIDLSNVKFWITGHSRGAAVGNLLAADLTNLAYFGQISSKALSICKKLKPENIYAYLFAVPSVVVDRDGSVQVDDLNDSKSLYSNIYNYVNPQDFVPYMPLPKWGYAKYGKTLTIPNDSLKESEEENNIFSKFNSNFYDCLEELFDTDKVDFYTQGTDTTLNIVDKLYSLAKNVKDYYNQTIYQIDTPLPECVDKTLNWWNPFYEDKIEIAFSPYSFFHNGLAKLMASIDEPLEKWDMLLNGVIVIYASSQIKVTDTYNTLLKYFVKYNLPLKDIVDIVNKHTDIEKIQNYIAANKPFAYAHCGDTYIASAFACKTIDDFDQDYNKYKTTKVACPVNVEVYDENGNLVGRVVDNVVDESVTTIPIYVDTGTESKYIYSPHDENYIIKAIGYDYGTMEYSVFGSNIKGAYVKEDYSVDNIIITPNTVVETDNDMDGSISLTATSKSNNHEDYVVTYTVDENNNVNTDETPRSHVFSTEWQSDETGHWHQCDCGKRNDFAAHTSKECAICGYISETKIEGTPVTIGSEGCDYTSVADAVKDIEKKIKSKTAEEAYNFVVSDGHVEKQGITLPKSDVKFAITGGAFTMSTPKITANADLTLYCALEPAKAGATITVAAAADKNVTIYGLATSSTLTLSGTKTSQFILDTDSTVNVASFATANLTIESGTSVKLDSKSKFTPTKLDGEGTIEAFSDAALTITEAEKATITLNQYEKASGKNVSVLLPKLTIATPVDVTITVKDKAGEDADIAGQTILTLAKADNIPELENKIKFTNKDGTNDLSAVQYKKDVRAEWLDALTLNDGTDDTNFSSFEKAFEKITEESAAADKAKPKQAYKSYTIMLNSDMAPEKFALPMKAAGITILGGGHALSLTGVTSLAPKYAFTLKNVNVTARDKQGKAAALTINGADALTVDGLLFDGKSLTVSSTKGATEIKDVTVPDDVPFIIKGGTKNNLTISDCPVVNQLTGFDVITLSDGMLIEKTFTTNTLDLGTTGNLITGNDPAAKKFTPAAITIKKLLTADGGQITLTEGFKPVTVSLAASGNIKLVSEEAIADTVQILNAAKCDLSVFDVTGIKGGSTYYALTRTQAKVYCKKTKLSMDGKKFVTFADVVSAIEAANAPAEEYEITLLEDYDNGGALKLPKAGTYEKLTIATGVNKFTFTGNVTLTGNTIVSGEFYAFDSKKNIQAKYSITAAKNCVFIASDADLGTITEIKGANSDIILADVAFNAATPVKITADQFVFSDVKGIIDTLTINTIKADGDQTLKLLAGKQHKVNTAQAATSGTITVLMVGADGQTAALKNNAVIFASFKGDRFDVDIENAGFGLSRETKGQFKVTAVSAA